MSLYTKYREIILYLFFGGVSFFINIGLFIFFNHFWDVLVSNIICWIICVLMQFYTNKKWVFQSYTPNIKMFFRQMGSFFTGRIFTLLVEEVILAVFITWLGFNSLFVKLSGQVFVIVMNYVISKMVVFNG